MSTHDDENENHDDHKTRKPLCTIEGNIRTKSRRIAQLRKELKVNDDNSATFSKQVSPGYISNSENERISQSIISGFFEHQFEPEKGSVANLPHDRHYHLKQIILPENEFGVQKCICTTIRPTLLPFPSIVRDWETCATFLSRYLEYEPLEDYEYHDYKDDKNENNNDENDIDNLDESFLIHHSIFSRREFYIPSPTQVLSWGIGDCFDFAILLASILMGCGYHVYVVYGKAEKWICQRDSEYLELSQDTFKHESTSLKDERNHDFDNVTETKQYMKQLSRSMNDKENDDSRHLQKNTKVDFSFYNKQIEHEKFKLKKKCGLHCWVLVKPNSRCPAGSDYFFLEPTIGKKFPCKGEHCPYHSIYSMWNTKNFWINKNRDGTFVDVNVDDSNHWEAVFYNTFHNAPRNKAADDQRIAFDPPFSWVDNLILLPESLQMKYPITGRRVINCRLSKIELFSTGFHPQHLVKRITQYEDHRKLHISDIVEYFGPTRHDSLIRRIKLPKEMLFHESFSPKHGLGLDEWIEILGSRRIIQFRPRIRADGLVKRDEFFGEKSYDEFIDRYDRLVNRSVYFKPDDDVKERRCKGHFIVPSGDGSQNVIITKIEENYKRDSSIRADNHSNIAKKTYLLTSNQIVVEYFNTDGGIAQKTIVYNKNDRYSTNGIATLVAELIHGEKMTLMSIRQLHQEVLDLGRMRRRDEGIQRQSSSMECDVNSALIIEKELSSTITVTCANSSPQTNAMNTISYNNDNSSQNDNSINIVIPHDDTMNSKPDYLFPFLSSPMYVRDANNITKEEALLIRDEYLKKIKERIKERGTIIQNKLDDEMKQPMDGEFDNNNSSERNCHSKNSRIKILQSRLEEYDELAMKKYKIHEDMVNQDKRLKAMYT